MPDHHGRSDARAQLKAYALASPKKASYRSGDDAAWILERVKVDTASLTADSFEVDAERKFPGRSKIAPAQALRQLGGLSACSSDYVDVFKTYQRKLNQLASGLRSNSSTWKKLKATASALNISTDGAFRNDDLIDILARLRALDMVERPVE